MNDLTLLIKPASSLCDLKCKYCFYSDVSNFRTVKSYGYMKEDTIEKIVKESLNYAKNSVSFVFQGGEPTLINLEFYELLITLQKKYNKKNLKIFNSIQTNGVFLNEEYVKFFSREKFLVGISLDGLSTIHDKYRIDSKGKGTFHRVEETINLLKKYHVDFNILCVVTKDVVLNFDDVFNELKKYRFLQFIPKIDDFSLAKDESSIDNELYSEFLIKLFKYYYKSIINEDYVSIRDFDNYILKLKGREVYSCSFNGKCGGYLAFEANGNAYPCDFYIIDKYYMGNIHNTTIKELINSKIQYEFIKESIINDKKCIKCKWYMLCKGGCRRLRDNKTSNLIYCEAYKKFFSECYEEMIFISKIL